MADYTPSKFKRVKTRTMQDEAMDHMQHRIHKTTGKKRDYQ